MKLHQSVSLRVCVLIIAGFCAQLELKAQESAPPLEIFMRTKNVPAGTTVSFNAHTTQATRWDPYGDLTSGYQDGNPSISGNYLGCDKGFDFADPGYLGNPSLGKNDYTIKVTNSGKSASFDVYANGCSFNRDLYVTYDWNLDQFFSGGGCSSYGSTSHTSATLYTGTGCLQPTNPSNLSVTASGGHPYLTWSASMPSVAKYHVYRSQGGGSFVQITSTALTTTSYIDYAVSTAGHTLFSYNVRAISGDLSKWSPGYSNTASIEGIYTQGSERSVVERVEGTRLEGNYPNPFNPETRIEYRLEESGVVRLVVLNVLGEEVAVLVEGLREAGSHQVVWNGRDGKGMDLPSGMYFSRIVAGSFTETKKMLLVR